MSYAISISWWLAPPPYTARTDGVFPFIFSKATRLRTAESLRKATRRHPGYGTIEKLYVNQVFLDDAIREDPSLRLDRELWKVSLR